LAPAKLPKPRAGETKAKRPSWSPKAEPMLFKEKGSEAWTPVKVLRLSPGVAREIVTMAETNLHPMKDGTMRAFGPDHPRKGFDIFLKFSKNESPAKMYTVRKERASKLSDTEASYLTWNLGEEKIQPLAAAIKDAEKMKGKVRIQTYDPVTKVSGWKDPTETESATDGGYEEDDVEGSEEAEVAPKKKPAAAKASAKKPASKAAASPAKKTAAAKKATAPPPKKAAGKKTSANGKKTMRELRV
jgi:hypothetical protein